MMVQLGCVQKVFSVLVQTQSQSPSLPESRGTQGKKWKMTSAPKKWTMNALEEEQDGPAPHSL